MHKQKTTHIGLAHGNEATRMLAPIRPLFVECQFLIRKFMRVCVCVCVCGGGGGGGGGENFYNYSASTAKLGPPYEKKTHSYCNTCGVSTPMCFRKGDNFWLFFLCAALANKHVNQQYQHYYISPRSIN